MNDEQIRALYNAHTEFIDDGECSYPRVDYLGFARALLAASASAEPVAYLSTEPRRWAQCRIKPHGSFTVPVFAHAERTEPLTDDEIEEISHQRETWSVVDFARAILAAAPRPIEAPENKK